MRLDMDCVRDVLLCIEENTGLRKFCVFIDTGLTSSAKFVGNATEPHDYQQTLLKKYDNDKLIYHVNFCLNSDLAKLLEGSSSYKLCVADLTPAGHEFLAKIRENSTWSKTKEIGGKIGSFSLNMVSKIAEGVATAYLNQQLGLL